MNLASFKTAVSEGPAKLKQGLVDVARHARQNPRSVLRQLGLFLVLTAALILFWKLTTKHEPADTWVFWRYAGYWLCTLSFCAGCLSTGDFIVRRLLPGRLPLREHLGTAFAVGLFVYYFVASAAGLAFVFGKAFFWLTPLIMFAVGARGLLRTFARLIRHVRHARRTYARPSSWTVVPIVAFGLLGFAMVYFAILTPDNVQFDSRWKHMALAEQYAVTGGIRRFPEGWTVETNPHLATFVYLWGFLLPYGQLFDRVELAAHLEFAIFVITTLSISGLVRKLIPRSRTRHVWAVRFLFPGIFLYDSSLSGGGDHIAALFAVPMFLMVLRGARDLSWRYTLIVALMTAGAAMSKLTCLLMFVPVAAILYVVRGGWLLLRPPTGIARKNALTGPGIALGVALLATSTFWLKNWVFYGDPIYPSLYKYLTLRPWTEDSENLFVWAYKDRFQRPTRDLDGVIKTLGVMFNFSFVPNDYPRYHGKVPVFGSLFTLFLPILLFFPRKGRRVWALAGAVHIAIFVWYWIHHEDRYLQALMPWMAAATGAALVLAWREGFLPKAITSALVSFQIVWGGDVYFLPTHAMAGSPIKKSVDFLAGTYKKDKNRFKTYAEWQNLGEKIPKGARVLLHDNHVHLGIGASTVSDWNAWQFGMSYARHPEPAQTWELMRKMGVTHIAWPATKSAGWDSIAGDLVFFSFANRDTLHKKRVGRFMLAEMPATAPDQPGIEHVLYLGCGKPIKNGLYNLADLSVSVFGPSSERYRRPRKTGDAAALATEADALVVEAKCAKSPPTSGFELVAKRKGLKNFKRAKELSLYLKTERAAPVSGSGGDAQPDFEEPDPEELGGDTEDDSTGSDAESPSSPESD